MDCNDEIVDTLCIIGNVSGQHASKYTTWMAFQWIARLLIMQYMPTITSPWKHIHTISLFLNKSLGD